jgi:glyoxylase-like metal-dependent hydrolase (beta-lactamase superfamily II)
MAVYLDSLARIRTMAPRAIAPGHGTVIYDPIAAIDEYVAHRHEREVQVERALLAGDRTIDAVVARLYADVKKELHPVAERTVHAHLLKLRAEGRVAGADADGEWAPAR